MVEVPKKTKNYLGPLTDTSRWENFKHRQDDIFICTPPKCGTTWTQAIIAMLVFGKVNHGLKSGMISPWIDAQLAPIDDYLQSETPEQIIEMINSALAENMDYSWGMEN